MARGRARKITAKNNDIGKVIGEISKNLKRGEVQIPGVTGQPVDVEVDPRPAIPMNRSKVTTLNRDASAVGRSKSLVAGEDRTSLMPSMQSEGNGTLTSSKTEGVVDFQNPVWRGKGVE